MSVSKRERNLFFIVFSIFNAAASFAHPVSPTLYSNYGLRSYIFGAVLAAMLLVNFAFSPFWGKLTAYFSSRKLMFISISGYALGQVFFGLSRTEAQFITARALTGLFVGGCWVTTMAYIVGVSTDPRERAKNLTIFATIQTVAGSFGFMAGGLLGEIYLYLPIIAQVALLFGSGLALLFICKGEVPPKYRFKEVNGREFVRDANPLAAFLSAKHFMTTLIAILLGICLMQNVGSIAFDQTFNYYLRDVFGFSPGYNGVLKGIMAALALAANATICIGLMRRTDIKRSIIPVLAAYGATMLAGVLAKDIYLFMVFNVGFYICNSISVPMLQAMVTDRARGEHMNMIIGFYNAIKSLGGVVGALLCSVLYPMGQKLPFIMGFAAIAIGTVLAVVYLAGCVREARGKGRDIAQS